MRPCLAVLLLVAQSALAVTLINSVGVQLGRTSATALYLTPTPAWAAAGAVTFAVSNADTAAHQFIVLRTTTDAGSLPVSASTHTVNVAAPGIQKVAQIDSIAPGASQTIVVQNLTAGHYVLLCNLPGHYSAGMFADFWTTNSLLFLPSQFQHRAAFIGGNATIYWNIAGNTISFGVEAQCTGWLGVSFGTAHSQSDMVVAYKNGTENSVADYSSTSVGWPSLDPISSLLTRTGPLQITPVTRQFTFSRLLDTGDATDATIVAGPMSVGMAYRNDDRTKIHVASQQRTITLLDPDSVVFSPSEFANKLSFLGGQVVVYYTVAGTVINFGVQAQTEGWVGLSLNRAHLAAGSDMWIASVQSGTPMILDSWSTGVGWPDQDVVDNLVNKVGPVQVGSARKFRFSRLLKTGDAMDVAITPGAPLLVGVALGPSDAHVVHTATDSQMVAFSVNASSGTIFYPSAYQHNFTVVPGSVFFYWTVYGSQISMALRVQTGGWVALGVTQGTGSGMRECDVVTGFQLGTVAVVKDQWVDGYVVPSDDPLLGGFYDLSNTQIIRSGDGFTTLVYSRKLVTGDVYDNPINLTSTQFAVAWSSSNDPTVPHTAQQLAMFTVNLNTGNSSLDPTGDLRGVHGILMFLGWGVFALLGLLPAWAIRGQSRGKYKWWIKMHYLLELLGMMLVVAGMVTIIIALNRVGTPHWNMSNATLGAHTIIGWILVLLAALQAVLGAAGYLGVLWEWKQAGEHGPPPKTHWFPNKIHIWTGRLMVLLVVVELYLGLVEYQNYVQELVWALTGWLLLLLILLLVLGVWRFRERVLGAYRPVNAAPSPEEAQEDDGAVAVAPISGGSGSDGVPLEVAAAPVVAPQPAAPAATEAAPATEAAAPAAVEATRAAPGAAEEATPLEDADIAMEEVPAPSPEPAPVQEGVRSTGHVDDVGARVVASVRDRRSREANWPFWKKKK